MDIIDFNKVPQGKKKVVKVIKKQVTEPAADRQQKNKEIYFQALDRIVQILKENNPTLATQTNINLEKPQIEKVGTRKSLWKNFEVVCNQMNRDPHHVCQYFLIELGTDGSFGEGKLNIKGKYSSSNIETLIKKYLHEYVLCSLCKSADTILIKDTESRLYSKECKNCKATKTVTTLKMNKRQK